MIKTYFKRTNDKPELAIREFCDDRYPRNKRYLYGDWVFYSIESSPLAGI